METLKTIGIAFIISFIVVSGINFLSYNGIGTTITQISGGDKLSDLDTLINTISSELNVGKMEISTTTLPLLTTLVNQSTAGTLTTGTWNADVLTVTYGGTGLATLSANQVLLGNGTGNIAFVSGLGTNGQFLTSGGAGTPPTWTTSSIDEGISYNFTGSAFRIKNLHASSTSANPLILNGVSYDFPLSNGASSTALWNDGSGSLIWDYPNIRSFLADGTAYTTSNTSTTTLKVVTIPAGTLGLNSQIRIRSIFRWNETSGRNNEGVYDIDFGDGTSTTTLIRSVKTTDQGLGGGGSQIRVAFTDIYINNQNSLSSQSFASNSYGTVANTPLSTASTTAYNTANVMFLEFKGRAINAGDVYGFTGIYIDIVRGD